MPQVDQFVSVTEVKNKLLDLIRNLKARQEIVAITRDGTPTAVLLSMEQFEGIVETIEILGDPLTMRSLKGHWLKQQPETGSAMRMKTAKLFRSGNIQAVRPKRLSWGVMIGSFSKFTPDFMKGGRKQLRTQQRGRAFS